MNGWGALALVAVTLLLIPAIDRWVELWAMATADAVIIQAPEPSPPRDNGCYRI